MPTELDFLCKLSVKKPSPAKVFGTAHCYCWWRTRASKMSRPQGFRVAPNRRDACEAAAVSSTVLIFAYELNDYLATVFRDEHIGIRRVERIVFLGNEAFRRNHPSPFLIVLVESVSRSDRGDVLTWLNDNLERAICFVESRRRRVRIIFVRKIHDE